MSSEYKKNLIFIYVRSAFQTQNGGCLYWQNTSLISVHTKWVTAIFYSLAHTQCFL